MAERVWKEILVPGTYNVAGRARTFTPEMIRHAADQGRRMVQSGLRIPLAWAHDERAYPEYQRGAWLSLGYFGEAKDLRVEPNGRLSALLEIDDPADARQFKRVGTVSPGLGWDFTDERWKKWPGMTVLHIAASPRPVQRDQARLNLSHPPAIRGAEHSVCMGYSSPVGTCGGKPMADKKTDDAVETETDPVETPAVVPPAAPVAPAVGFDAELLGLLAANGLTVGDDVKTMDDLKGRLKALAANAANKPGDDDLGLGSTAQGGATTAASTGPILMSQDTPEPIRKAHAAVILAEKKRLNRQIVDMVKGGLNPQMGRKLTAELEKVDLSLAGDGTIVEVPVLTRIATTADLLKAGGWTPTTDDAADLSHATPKPPPAELVGDPDADTRAALEFARNRNKPAAK